MNGLSSVKPQNHKAKLKKMFFYAFVLLALVLFTGIAYLADLMEPVTASADIAETLSVEIPKGCTTSEIGKMLEEKGLIKSRWVFKILTRLKGYEGKYMAGTYAISTGMDIQSIMEEMVQGNVLTETVRFTIPEGFELKQIAELLDQKGIVSKEEFLKEAEEGQFDYEFLEDLPERDNRLEGYLFPDTYEVYVGEDAHSIIDRMLSRFENVAGEIGLIDEDKRNGLSIDQIVTLASIIEKEAANDRERPIISAVFQNRLKKGMKLQSCATVQYVLQERKPRLTYDDLKIDSPYNTYKVPGLPIGPIASPGKESLKAAMHPAQVDYLYFVVQVDGTHRFSKSYSEFLQHKKNSYE